MRDKYLQRQIFDLIYQVRSLAFGEKKAKQSFQTMVDFFFDNIMLFKLSNCLPMELTDFFLMLFSK